MRGSLILLALALVIPRPLCAQTPPTINADLTFYGDNTEFSNPFREGETLLGVRGRLFLDVDLSARATLRLGVFGNQRFGAEHGVDDVKPVITLVVHRPGNRFLFGAIDTNITREEAGPDRDGPHALLPPLQRETLAFTRGYEAGVQWIRRSARERHDSWINWQQLNTPGQREIFDTGVNARVLVRSPVWAAFQAHIVHHGGQLFNDGPVSDSVALAPGIVVSRDAPLVGTAGAEAYVLRAFYRPDRAVSALTQSGTAVLVRLSAERQGWRGHLIAWRGCDFITEEGDLNYLSVTRSGIRITRTRDYGEVGLTRRYALGDGVSLEASARLHRIESRYQYSYRILARVRARGTLAWP